MARPGRNFLREATAGALETRRRHRTSDAATKPESGKLCVPLGLAAGVHAWSVAAPYDAEIFTDDLS